MFRIISTAQLAELKNLASAFPMVRSKCDGLEKNLETEQRRTKELTAKAEQDAARFRQELADVIKQADARVAEARTSMQRTQGQAAALVDTTTSRADQTARELKAQIEQLTAQLAAGPVLDEEGLIARYENLVGAPVDLTLQVTQLGTSYPQAELKIALVCRGCDYTEEETRQGYDDADSRQSFVTGDYTGGKLKRWAQEHAERCRAVALPLQRTA